MKETKKKTQIEEIIKEESNIFWWLKRDLTTLSVKTSEGMELSLTPAQEDGWEESIHAEVRSVARFLKTHSALLLPDDDRAMAVTVYKKLNKSLWETKESTFQYAKEKLEITDILPDIQKALLLVQNKTPILGGLPRYGYDFKGESISTRQASTVRDEAICALSRLVTVEDKNGNEASLNEASLYHEKVVDIFLEVIENRGKEKWSTVHSAILGLWPFLSETTILIELLFQSAASEKITYEELITSEAAAVALKNQAICLPGGLNEHRSHIENILNLAYQEYLKKKHILEENPVKNKDLLKPIRIIYHCLDRCLEEIEKVKIQEEKEKQKKKVEKKKTKIQHPIEMFIDKEALILISLLIDNKEKLVEYFLNDPRHLEIHLSYVQRCIEIISDAEACLVAGEACLVKENELNLWLNNHPLRKVKMLSFFKKMEDELNHCLKDKLSCPQLPGKIEVQVEIAKCHVCGKDVSVEKTEQKIKYKGIIYYFCSNRCKTVFEEEFAKYHQLQ
ncbi:MAG: YHS domain-containing protein [Nitrospirota bacterium]